MASSGVVTSGSAKSPFVTVTWPVRPIRGSAPSGNVNFNSAAPFGASWNYATVGNTWEYDFPLEAGSYRFNCFFLKGSNTGILIARINGSQIGTFDTYEGFSIGGMGSVTSTTISESGDQTVSFEVSSSKNASSSGFRINFSGFSMSKL